MQRDPFGALIQPRPNCDQEETIAIDSRTEACARGLQTVGLFHYVLGAITGLMSCIPLLHVTVGLWLLVQTLGRDSGPSPAMGLGFALFFGLFAVAGWALAI